MLYTFIPKKNFSYFKLIILSLFFLFLSACSSNSNDENDNDLRTDACDVLGLSPLKIINGTACSNDPNPVVKILLDFANGTSVCTGTMITSTKLVTASHCVTNGTFQNVIRPSAVSISRGNSNNPIAKARRIFNASSALADLKRIETEAIKRGDLNLIENDAEVFFQYVEEYGLSDIAVIELDRAVNLPTIPIKISSTPAVGSVVSIFGYGLTSSSTPITPTNVFSGQMRIQSIGVKNIFAKFSGSGSNTCGGDSGGPMIESLVDGSVALVGSTLGGTNNDCSVGDRSSFTAMAGAGISTFLKAVAPEANYR